jgi:hypothetical protein
VLRNPLLGIAKPLEAIFSFRWILRHETLRIETYKRKLFTGQRIYPFLSVQAFDEESLKISFSKRLTTYMLADKIVKKKDKVKLCYRKQSFFLFLRRPTLYVIISKHIIHSRWFMQKGSIKVELIQLRLSSKRDEKRINCQ